MTESRFFRTSCAGDRRDVKRIAGVKVPQCVVVDNYETVRDGWLQVFDILLPPEYERYIIGRKVYYYPPDLDIKKPWAVFVYGDAASPAVFYLMGDMDKEELRQLLLYEKEGKVPRP